jgi:hypothetical protein
MLFFEISERSDIAAALFGSRGNEWNEQRS